MPVIAMIIGKPDFSDLTFTINDANVAPRIGKLEIDIKGDAPAVLQLASYDQINASRFVDFEPEDISGEVKGHVSADIPLEPDAPSERGVVRVESLNQQYWSSRFIGAKRVS